MKNYARIITKATSSPWLIEPHALTTILQLLEAHVNGTLDRSTVALNLADVEKRDNAQGRVGSVGVLPLHGPIFPRANMMTELSGAVDLSQWQKDFHAMLADDSIKSIVMDVDSPGGMSDLIPETMQMIREGRQIKPIYSIANTAANSAAYGIAAQASEMYSTPSGQLGSVGTFLVHTDENARFEQAGVKNTVIKAGRFKAINYESLTPEARESLQTYVNDVNEGFLAGIAQGRGVDVEHVRHSFGEGMIVSPQRALDARMINGIATLEEVIHAAGGGVIGGTSSTSAVPHGTQHSYDADKEHSEPGTGLGGEPTPREPPETGDPAIVGGWRRDTPPPEPFPEPEESAMNRAWLEDRATALSIEYTAETSDEDLANLVAQQVDSIVVPIAAATANVEEQRAFERDYPEHAAQLRELASDRVETGAKMFADGYALFEGERRGFSTLVRENIEQAHLKISTRQFSHNDLKELLDLTTKKESVVERGEIGSSRAIDLPPVPAHFSDARQEFARRVRAAMTEDNLSREDAIKHVSETDPELARAYATGHATR